MRKFLITNKRMVVGLQGFEPWTSPTRTERSTKLSHSPNDPSSREERQEGYSAMFAAACKHKWAARNAALSSRGRKR
jgi:hypothetical protein